MSRWRRFHYSASLAVIVAALAELCNGYGGELILLPGTIAKALFLEVPLSSLLTDGDLYVLPSYLDPILAACLYFPAIYFVLLLRTWFKEGAWTR